MTDKIKYAQIDNNASEFEEECQKPVHQWRGWISTTSSFLLGLVTMGIVIAVYSAFILPKQSHARNLPHAHNGSDPNTGLPLSFSHGDCGNSFEEAKERGCQYNTVLHAWLPKSCVTDADTEDAKDMYKDRRWVYTTNLGQNLTMKELGAGDYESFTTTSDFHVTHCMYVWKRLHRIMLDPMQELDTYTANYEHTGHCVEMIAGHVANDAGTKIFVKYPKCAK